MSYFKANDVFLEIRNLFSLPGLISWLRPPFTLQRRWGETQLNVRIHNCIHSTAVLCYTVTSICVWLFVTLQMWPTGLLHPWDSPGKNTGVGCHALLQDIFLTQGSNLSLLHFLHWQVDSLPLAPPRKPLQWFEKNPKCINRWVLVPTTHLLQKYIFYHYIIYHIKYICVNTNIHDKLRQRNKHSQENENQTHIHMTSSVRLDIKSFFWRTHSIYSLYFKHCSLNLF